MNGAQLLNVAEVAHTKTSSCSCLPLASLGCFLGDQEALAIWALEVIQRHDRSRSCSSVNKVDKSNALASSIWVGHSSHASGSNRSKWSKKLVKVQVSGVRRQVFDIHLAFIRSLGVGRTKEL